MSKFNVGDYVRVIDKNSKRFNSIGVITRFELYHTVVVKFEDTTVERLHNQSLEQVFKVGDTVIFNFIGTKTKGVIVNRMSDGRWIINHNKGTTSGVPASEMKPLSKENNADTCTKVKIDEIKSISIKEENNIMKSEQFVSDIFNRVKNYISYKSQEAIDIILAEDKNYKEAQTCMQRLKELHDDYHPDEVITMNYGYGSFCSPATIIRKQAVDKKYAELMHTLDKKKDLIIHALQVDENMSSEAVFKLLNSYGLTDECGKALPVTEGLIYDLLELPEVDELF